MKQTLEDGLSVWLCLSSALEKPIRHFIKNNQYKVTLNEGTINKLPNKPQHYEVVFTEFDKDFLSWQRWHLQCLSHQLKDQGYLFIKAFNFPTLNAGFIKFILNFIRWCFLYLSFLTKRKDLQKSLISSKFLAMASTYGLHLVTVPEQLKFLKFHGIVFQKFTDPEIRYKKELEEEKFLRNEIQTTYNDRVIEENTSNIKDVQFIEPQYNTILVLAPHPDDELVGCGGTLLKLSASGAKVHILQMTEGITSRGLDGESTNYKNAIRWEEAKLVAAHFGFEQYYWPTGTDSKLVNNELNQLKLSDLIKTLNPDLIFVPSDDDQHEEHRIAFQIFNEVAQNFDNKPFVLKYPVWGALNDVTHVMSVSGYTNQVLEAMYLYKTAMKPEDYNKRMLAIWSYQSLKVLETPKKSLEVFSEHHFNKDHQK